MDELGYKTWINGDVHMKEWFTEVVYIQRGNVSGTDQSGSHELTDLLNGLEQDGWDIQGTDVLEKYHVLVVANREKKK